MIFKCWKCNVKIDFKDIEDKEKLKALAEKHFRDKHNMELKNHELNAIN